MRKPPLTLLLAAVLLLGSPGLAAAGTHGYGMGEAPYPFGKTVKEVRDLFPDTEMTREETPYIESIGNYSLDRYFEGGIRRDPEQGTCFYPSVVRKYTVHLEKAGQDMVEDLTFYFEGLSGGRQPHRLFMVKVVMAAEGEPEGDYKSVFHRVAARISEEAGMKPDVSQGTYQDFRARSHAFYSPALVGVWDGEDTLVFLMVADSSQGPVRPEIISVSKEGLSSYLKACKFMSDGG